MGGSQEARRIEGVAPCIKFVLGSAGLRRVVVGVIGGCPARAKGSTCRPCGGVIGSAGVVVLCGPPPVSAACGKECAVGLRVAGVRVGEFPAGARAHLRM